MPVYIISFYVPVDHAEFVKDAMFSAGAGRIGAYDLCCWQTLGQGQFRPLEGSKPFIGERDKVETVSELKVEMVCEAECLNLVVAALWHAHPYETPAFHVLKDAT
jgi:hypothetical protein